MGTLLSISQAQPMIVPPGESLVLSSLWSCSRPNSVLFILSNRLVGFNYPSAAAAATDLGGIEKARGKAAMTIGLGTISYNPNAKVIIMAAGEGKATVVRAGIEDPADIERPSTVLHKLPNARFFITHGAANHLFARKQENIANISSYCLDWALNHLCGDLTPAASYLAQPEEDYLLLESCIYEMSLTLKKPVHLLDTADLESDKHLYKLPAWIRSNPLAFKTLCACASRRLKEKIEGGLRESSPVGLHIVHTAPHHDDIMLSYHAAMHDMLGRQAVNYNPSRGSSRVIANGGEDSLVIGESSKIRKPRSGSYSSYRDNLLGERFNDNINHFAYLTSGFHSVNEDFLHAKVAACFTEVDGQTLLEQYVRKGYLTLEYDDLMSEFHQAFFDKDETQLEQIENVIFLRKIAEVWKITLTQNYSQLIAELKEKVGWIQNDYLCNHQPGDAVPK